MKDIIELFNAETVWEFITEQKQEDFSKRQEYYLNCAKKFGILCALNVSGKGQTDLSKPRPIDSEFIETYNEISSEIIKKIDDKSKVRLSDIGDSIKNEGKMNDTISAICYGDTENIRSQYALDGKNIDEYLDEQNRIKIISNYGACLNALKNAYGSDSLYKVFETAKEARK